MRRCQWETFFLGQSKSGSHHVLDLKPLGQRILEALSFRTCRPLSSFLAKISTCFAPMVGAFVFFKKLVDTFVLACLSRQSNLREKCIRLRIASSKAFRRLVVRNIISLKFSSIRKKTETRELLVCNPEVRCSRNRPRPAIKPHSNDWQGEGSSRGSVQVSLHLSPVLRHRPIACQRRSFTNTLIIPNRAASEDVPRSLRPSMFFRHQAVHCSCVSNYRTN